MFLRMLREAGCEDPLRASRTFTDLKNGGVGLWLPVARRGQAWKRLVDVLGEEAAQRFQASYGARNVRLAKSTQVHRYGERKRRQIESLIGVEEASTLFARFGGDWLDLPGACKVIELPVGHVGYSTQPQQFARELLMLRALSTSSTCSDVSIAQPTILRLNASSTTAK